MVAEEERVYRGYHKKEAPIADTRNLWLKQRFLHDTTNRKILEIGVGGGGVIQFLKEKNQVCGVDISASGIKMLGKKGIRGYTLDVSKEKLPFKSAAFDIVLCFETLEHLKNPQHCIDEIQRALKKDGTTLISVPNPRIGHKFIYPGLFTFKHFRSYLLNNGFKIASITPWYPSTFFKINPPQQKDEKLATYIKSKVFNRLMSVLDFFLFKKIKQKFFAMCWVFKLQNTNPKGSKILFKKIADETKKFY